MSGVRITISGGENINSALRRAAAELASPEKMYAEIGLALQGSTQLRFEQGKGPDGSPWPKSIRAMFGGNRTLIGESRNLWQKITFEASPTGVRVGTDVLYAAVHQFGATIKPKKGDRLFFTVGGRKVAAKQVRIPARPFLGLSKSDEAEITQIIDDEIRDLLG